MLRKNEQRLADAIVSFAREHGVPNRVTFSELVAHFDAAASPVLAGGVWGRANVAIPEFVAQRGFVVVRADDGALEITAGEPEQD